ETEITEHAAKVGGKRNLREVEVMTDDGYTFCYLIKKPSRPLMRAVTNKERKKDTDGIEKLMMGCVLEGDCDAYEYDGAIYSSLITLIGQLINTAKASIKKI